MADAQGERGQRGAGPSKKTELRFGPADRVEVCQVSLASGVGGFIESVSTGQIMFTGLAPRADCPAKALSQLARSTTARLHFGQRADAGCGSRPHEDFDAGESHVGLIGLGALHRTTARAFIGGVEAAGGEAGASDWGVIGHRKPV